MGREQQGALDEGDARDVCGGSLPPCCGLIVHPCYCAAALLRYEGHGCNMHGPRMQRPACGPAWHKPTPGPAWSPAAATSQVPASHLDLQELQLPLQRLEPGVQVLFCCSGAAAWSINLHVLLCCSCLGAAGRQHCDCRHYCVLGLGLAGCCGGWPCWLQSTKMEMTVIWLQLQHAEQLGNVQVD